MNILGALLTIALCLLACISSRRSAALAFVAGVLYLTQGQALHVAGINFTAIRIIESFVFLRVLAKGELKTVVVKPIDRWLMASLGVYMSVVMIRTGEFDFYSFGNSVDACLTYFTFRALLTTSDELIEFFEGMAVLIIPFAMLMVFEAFSGRNLFEFMGGVPALSELRNGHYRCQGSFRHAILAGSLGATFAPIFGGLWFHRESRRRAMLGVLGCMSIVISSHSSGPLMTLAVALTAWSCWYVRNSLKWVRRGILAAVISLHLIMKQPVWFIFDRISSVTGGDGWHRSNLIDQFVRHVSEWWLMGMPIEDTGSWAATKLAWGGVDVTNYYISIGILGGLVSLIVFIKYLTSCFSFLGRALHSLRGNPEAEHHLEYLVWGIGCSLAAHAVNISAVLYWDQSYVIWYLHLALVASISIPIIEGRLQPFLAEQSPQLAAIPSG